MDAFEFHPSPAEVAPVNPNTSQDIAWTILKYIGFFLLFLCALGVVSQARADDSGENHLHRPAQVSEDDPGVTGGHPKQHKTIHERFYSDWDRLDMVNKSSCCSNEDCFPTIMLQDENGSWWALKREIMQGIESRVAAGEDPKIPSLESAPGAWVLVPPDKIEHNSLRVDLGVKRPREARPSPDGRSHACITTGDAVLCAVVGEGV